MRYDQASNLAMKAASPVRMQNAGVNIVEDGPPPAISGVDAVVWRLFDVIAAFLLLTFILPFLAMLAASVFISDPGPVFYRHRRLGQGGRYFQCIKFRTMRVDGDEILAAHLSTSAAAKREWEATHKLRNDPRVTPLGAIMRKLSLDELPQLLNVLSGDMSIVGPRPIVEQEVQKYGFYFEHYCRVRPGLTGIWQTSGRSDTSYHQRVTMDVSYVMRKSVAFDMWLMAKTVPAVLMAKGSY